MLNGRNGAPLVTATSPATRSCENPIRREGVAKAKKKVVSRNDGPPRVTHIEFGENRLLNWSKGIARLKAFSLRKQNFPENVAALLVTTLTIPPEEKQNSEQMIVTT